MISRYSALAVAALSVLLAAGCGGGGSSGGSGSADPDPTPAPTPTPTPVPDDPEPSEDDRYPSGQIPDSIAELLDPANSNPAVGNMPAWEFADEEDRIFFYDPELDLATSREKYVDLRIPVTSDFEILAVKYGALQKQSDGSWRYFLPLYRLDDPAWNDYQEQIGFIANGIEYTASFPLSRDPLFFQQWHLRNTGQSAFIDAKYVQDTVAGEDLNVSSVWRDGITGKGVKVAVIDDDFEYTHEDLAANADTSHSYNAKTGTSDTRSTVTGEYGAGHGTAVAGIIAAEANNGVGVKGIAYEASVFGLVPVERETRLITGSEIRSADVINQSYGYVRPYIQYDQIDDYDAFRARKVVVTRSAGNSFHEANDTYDSGKTCRELGINCFFAQGDYALVNHGTIAVASLAGDGTHAGYSSAGSYVWISAYGGQNTLLVTPDRSGCQYRLDGGEHDLTFMSGESPYNPDCNYANVLSGTSGAAPEVAGVAALIKSAVPGITLEQVKYVLARTAVNDKSDRAMADADVKDPSLGSLTVHRGWTDTGVSGLRYSALYGFGRVDAAKAVELAGRCRYDSNCARRASAPDIYHTTDIQCEQVNGSSSYYSYKCALGNVMNDEGISFLGSGQIEYARLVVTDYLFYGDSINGAFSSPSDLVQSQYELQMDGNASRVSIPKQMHEGIYKTIGSTEILMSNNVFYLSPYNGQKFILHIRSPKRILTDSIDARVDLEVYR
ncbi:MAG: S8 family serine peptidase [Succinivibrionaceae bacterium]|nr:S8 family serine peptidase [Succinivibrionaceae bacterium]